MLLRTSFPHHCAVHYSLGIKLWNSRSCHIGVVYKATSAKRQLNKMAEESAIMEVDGGIMEGGGQILRISTALSCLLGIQTRVVRIRAGRSTPGLRPQHLSGLVTVRDLCAGQLENAEIGSTEVTFTPGKIKGGALTADTKTAGSVCLLLQVSLPCVLFAESPSELIFKGGTNAEMAPQIDYTTMVFKPIAEKFSFKLDCDIRRRGYYPRGGGEILVRVAPVKYLNPINLTDRGTITKIYGRAFVAGVLPYKMVKDMTSAAVRCIRRELRDLYVNIQAVQESGDKAVGNGSGIIIVAETSTGCLFAGSALGKRGVSADRVGAEAAEILLRNLHHGGCVDEYLQDQLIIFMALADGVSLLRTGPLTLHTQTAIHFAEQMTKAKFSIKKCEDSDSESYIIECQGIGLQNKNI
ncbi:RNA 3 -terminal phosphate cyclase isoform X1 [Pelobates cultripes]|uniref:RNA 3'-terminal phosphate cyclase n=1 Tax=Pelobates cultripes TaxID=61616 RepID=A0AAD1SWB9_PELCU|nr:RNA 3 -terminal phosphate cyclase isoform X1 [Pelobates cultripes]